MGLNVQGWLCSKRPCNASCGGSQCCQLHIIKLRGLYMLCASVAIPPQSIGGDQHGRSTDLVATTQGGDLRQAFARDELDEYAWHDRGRQIALDIARGLHFLHTSGVIHRSCLHCCALADARAADVGSTGRHAARPCCSQSHSVIVAEPSIAAADRVPMLPAAGI